jgi:hypothetical protein
MIAGLSICDGCRPIRTNRGLNRSAASAIFDGKMQAPDEKETNTQCEGANDQRNQNWRNYSELDSRCAFSIQAPAFQLMSHGSAQPHDSRSVDRRNECAGDTQAREYWRVGKGGLHFNIDPRF